MYQCFSPTHQRPVGQIHEMIESQYRQRSLAYSSQRRVVSTCVRWLLDVNRRRSICSWFEYFSGSAAIFFCLLLLRLRLVSFESPCFDRGRSKAGGEQCAACQCVSTQQAYTRMGYVEDIYRVCLRSIRMDVTYRLEDGSQIYIYLISMFYNAVDTVYVRLQYKFICLTVTKVTCRQSGQTFR